MSKRERDREGERKSGRTSWKLKVFDNFFISAGIVVVVARVLLFIIVIYLLFYDCEYFRIVVN